ncbi:MAG: hypothetical protein GX671_00055 [Clostridiales bacterium]|nr:hypothetical protein [Clostridiales bacterium]
MKRFTSFIGRVKQSVTRDYIKYTLIFLFMMLLVYFYLLFAGMTTAPKFTYAEF